MSEFKFAPESNNVGQPPQQPVPEQKPIMEEPPQKVEEVIQHSNDVKDSIMFPAITPEKQKELVEKYKYLPIELVSTHAHGDIIVRALALSEVDDLYMESSTELGEVDNDLLQNNQLKRCVVWPENFVDIVNQYEDKLLGGLAHNTLRIIDYISGTIGSVLPIPLSEYAKRLRLFEEAETNEEAYNRYLQIPENQRIRSKHPTMEDIEKYKKWEQEGMQVRVVSIPITDTDYVYRSFSIKDSRIVDQQLMESGGLNPQTLVLTEVQKVIVARLTLFPQDTSERLLNYEFGFPAWLASLLAEGIYNISGAIKETTKSLNKG